jgi:hypothetical protein
VRLIAGIATASAGLASFAVMGIAFGQVLAAENDAGFHAYRRGLGPEQHACDLAASGFEVTQIPGASPASEVDSLCKSAGQWNTVGIATAVTGGALTLGGAALILTSRTVWPRIRNASRAPAFELVPSVGETSGIVARGSF